MEVRLTRAERTRIGYATRRYIRERWGHDTSEPGVLDDAALFIAPEIDSLGRFADTPYTDLDDYAWAFARFLFPHAARNSG